MGHKTDTQQKYTSHLTNTCNKLSCLCFSCPEPGEHHPDPDPEHHQRGRGGHCHAPGQRRPRPRPAQGGQPEKLPLSGGPTDAELQCSGRHSSTEYILQQNTLHISKLFSI